MRGSEINKMGNENNIKLAMIIFNYGPMG